MATWSARMGNPTEPMAQGLLVLLPSSIIAKEYLGYYTFLIITLSLFLRYRARIEYIVIVLDKED